MLRGVKTLSDLNKPISVDLCIRLLIFVFKLVAYIRRDVDCHVQRCKSKLAGNNLYLSHGYEESVNEEVFTPTDTDVLDELSNTKAQLKQTVERCLEGRNKSESFLCNKL